MEQKLADFGFGRTGRVCDCGNKWLNIGTTGDMFNFVIYCHCLGCLARGPQIQVTAKNHSRIFEEVITAWNNGPRKRRVFRPKHKNKEALFKEIDKSLARVFPKERGEAIT